MSRGHQRTRGQAMTEFALILPIFALMLFGIIDLGRYVYTANALNNGAREGARFASVGVRPAECAGLSRAACAQAVASNRSWGISPSSVTVTPSCLRVDGDGTLDPVAVASCRTGDLLTVRSTTDFTLVTPLIAQLLGSQTIAGEARVTVNQ